MTELATVDVLIIDDFALEPMSREESRDIYQLFVERSEQGGCRDVAGRPDIRRLGERDGGRRICVDRPAIGRFPIRSTTSWREPATLSISGAIVAQR